MAASLPKLRVRLIRLSSHLGGWLWSLSLAIRLRMMPALLSLDPSSTKTSRSMLGWARMAAMNWPIPAASLKQAETTQMAGVPAAELMAGAGLSMAGARKLALVLSVGLPCSLAEGMWVG